MLIIKCMHLNNLHFWTYLSKSATCWCKRVFPIKGVNHFNWCRMFYSIIVCRLRVDLAFLVDGSGSIENQGKGNFMRVLDFVKTLISFFPISARQTRVGMVLFSTRPYPIFRFNRYYSKTSLIKAVDRVRYPYGGTRLGRALRYVSRYAIF